MIDMPEWGGPRFESHAAAPALPFGEWADPPHLDCLICKVKINQPAEQSPWGESRCGLDGGAWHVVGVQ